MNVVERDVRMSRGLLRGMKARRAYRRTACGDQIACLPLGKVVERVAILGGERSRGSLPTLSPIKELALHAISTRMIDHDETTSLRKLLYTYKGEQGSQSQT